MRRIPILFVEVGALLGVSASVSTLSDGDIETILSIIAQALVILYALIKLLKEKPVDVKKVIAKLWELLTLILKAFKIIGGVKLKRKAKKEIIASLEDDEDEKKPL